MNRVTMVFTVKADSVAELVTEAYTHAENLAGNGWRVCSVSQKYAAEQVEADEQTYHTATRHEVQSVFTATYTKVEA